MSVDLLSNEQLSQANHDLRARLAETERALQSRLREIAALHQISALMLREQPLRAVLHEVVQEISACTGFPITTIEFYDETRQVMEFAAATGVALPADLSSFTVPVAATLSGVVARSGQALIEIRALERPEYADVTLRRLGVQSFVCVPMYVKGRVIGVVALAHPESVPLAADLVPMTQNLANFVATFVARKWAEEQRADTEQQGHEVLAKLAAGVVLMDVNGRYLLANERAASMFGSTPDAVIGKTLFDFLAPEVAQSYLERNRAFIAARIAAEYEGTFTLPVGTRTFFISDQVLLDAQGNGYALLSSSIDITKHKQVEAELQVALTKYRTLFEAFPLGITVSDRNGQIVEANLTAERLLGLGREEQRQRQIDGAEWQIVHADGTPLASSEYPSVQALKEQRLVSNVELGVVTPAGTTTWINVTASPLPLGDDGVVITYNDITARKQAEDNLRASEARYRSLFEHMAEGYAYCEMLFVDGVAEDWIYLEVNAAFETLTGLKAVRGKRVSAVLPGIRTTDPQLFEIYARVATTGQHEKFELWLATLQQWFSVSVYSPAPTYFVSVFELITTRKQAEAALHASTAKLEAALESMTDAVFISDLEGRFIHFNDAFATFHKFRHKDECAKTLAEYPAFLEVYLPDGTLAPLEQWAIPRALRGETVTNAEYTLRRKDTGETWIGSYNFAPIRDQVGTIVGSVTIGRDITKRKQDEVAQHQALEELRRSEYAFRTLYENMRDGFVSVDMHGVFRQYNRSFREMLGYTDEELAKLTYNEVTPSKWHALEAHILQEQILPRGYSEVYEKEYQTKSGRSIPVELRTMLIRDEAGQPAELWAVVRDITARKQTEAVLHQTMEELTRSNADLEQFASVASHDLQEPLRAVTSMVQLLQQRYQGQIDARADQYIGLAVEAASRMQALINDLLTFSRVQRRGKSFVPVLAEMALNDALANLQMAITESAAEITHTALPAVLADPSQLTQLFQNLLGNALKFRSEEVPRIHISAERRADAWCFAVRDNGIGIGHDYFERIFVIFQRLHPRRTYPGTGIGLALCKKIVERHGGQIWVESHLGHGATFFFTLPDRSQPHDDPFVRQAY